MSVVRTEGEKEGLTMIVRVTVIIIWVANKYT